MNNMIELAKQQVKETVMNALGRLVAEGKIEAVPLPLSMLSVLQTYRTEISPQCRNGKCKGAQKQSESNRSDDSRCRSA